MQETEKRDIRELTDEELKNFISEKEQPAFRAKQLSQWLWQKSAHSFEEMTNLSNDFRELLAENFKIGKSHVDYAQQSNDRTIKYGVKLHDDELVESVLIPTKKRITACVSSQVGCSLSCKFCATGYLARKRNLTAFEIYEQIVHVKDEAEEKFQRPLTNIVMMGMGEPLLNYQNVLKAISYISSKDGLGMSPKRITLSTAGIAKMIIKLADDQVKFNLALSLHAANDKKRNEIMPINESNTLAALSDSLRYFYEQTGNKITLEYIVFDGFNDEIEDADELVQFARKFPCKINIIEYNPIDQADFTNATEDKLDAFARYLEEKGQIVNVRRSRGKDIDAACGQLAGKNN